MRRKGLLAPRPSAWSLGNDYTSSSSNPAALDYNPYYISGNANSATFVWQGKTYHGITAYQAASARMIIRSSPTPNTSA